MQNECPVPAECGIENQLSQDCPGPVAADVHYSVDLVFRFLPDLLKFARSSSDQDPLLEYIVRWLHEWPLSCVQRLTLAQLPATVTLDDSMAMMEGMNMSSFGSVVVSARVTTSGSAMAQAGDYIGEFMVNDVSQTEHRVGRLRHSPMRRSRFWLQRGWSTSGLTFA